MSPLNTICHKSHQLSGDKHESLLSFLFYLSLLLGGDGGVALNGDPNSWDFTYAGLLVRCWYDKALLRKKYFKI